MQSLEDLEFDYLSPDDISRAAEIEKEGENLVLCRVDLLIVYRLPSR